MRARGGRFAGTVEDKTSRILIAAQQLHLSGTSGKLLDRLAVVKANLLCGCWMHRRRIPAAAIGIQRRQDAGAVPAGATAGQLGALALQAVQIGVHALDGGVDRRALTDIAAEQRKAAAGIA